MFPVPGRVFFLLKTPIRELLATAKVYVLPLHLLKHVPCRSLLWFIKRYHSWIGLLVASLIWEIAWCVQVPLKLVLREETFRSVQTQKSQGSASEVHSVFTNKDLPYTSMVQTKAIAISYRSVNLLDTLANN